MEPQSSHRTQRKNASFPFAFSVSFAVQNLFPSFAGIALRSALALFLTMPLFATGQEPERIRIKGKEYSLLTNPLQAWIDNLPDKTRPFFSQLPDYCSSTANWRGYVATWEIMDSGLWLIEIDSWDRVSALSEKDVDQQLSKMTFPEDMRPGMRRLLARSKAYGDPSKWVRWSPVRLFPSQAKNSRVFASWFTGELRIPEGEMLRYVHMGYGSVHERERFIQIKNGFVVSERVVDNRGKEIPGEMELMRQELEKMKQDAKEKPASPLNQKLIPDPPKAQ